MTIPRLELMGCLLGSQLALYAYNSLEDLLPSQTSIYFHTDSEISAYWITDSDIFSLKQFVNRRTKMIRQNMNELKDKVSEQRMVEIELRHIPGHENPADITSRGSTFKTFFDPKNLQSYLHGPPWLTQSKEHWPSQPETFDPRLSHHFEDFKRESLEVKKDEGSCELLGVVNNMDIGINRNEGLLKFLDQIFARHGFLKSIRILTYIFRFLKRTLGQTKTSSVFLFKRNQSTTVIPGASEVNEVRTDIIKLIQSSNYDHMVRKDGTGRLVVSKKVQRELGGGILFRDSNNILRLKGRLPDSRNAHQILLPGKSEFFYQMILHEHELTLHGSQKTVANRIRKSFFVPGLQSKVKKLIGSCVQCAKANSRPFKVEMGRIPEDRLFSSRPWAVVGMDHLVSTFILGQDNKWLKCHILLFVCATTRNVHLELVNKLNFAETWRAFSNFISFHGIPDTCYSDGFQVFKTMSIEAKRWKTLTSLEKFQTELSNKGVEWHFSTPAAPWTGFWERHVGLVKQTLHKTVQQTKIPLTFLYAQTLLHSVAHAVNCHPLCSAGQQDDSEDFITPFNLTAGYNTIPFLYSVAQMEKLRDDGAEIDLQALHKSLHKERQRLYGRFQKTYLLELNKRKKWTKTGPNVPRVGQLVMMTTEGGKRFDWPLAIISRLEVSPRDGQVRRVFVRCKGHDNELECSIRSLVPLEHPIDI